MGGYNQSLDGNIFIDEEQPSANIDIPEGGIDFGLLDWSATKKWTILDIFNKVKMKKDLSFINSMIFIYFWLLYYIYIILG